MSFDDRKRAVGADGSANQWSEIPGGKRCGVRTSGAARKGRFNSAIPHKNEASIPRLSPTPAPFGPSRFIRACPTHRLALLELPVTDQRWHSLAEPILYCPRDHEVDVDLFVLLDRRTGQTLRLGRFLDDQDDRSDFKGTPARQADYPIGLRLIGVTAEVCRV